MLSFEHTLARTVDFASTTFVQRKGATWGILLCGCKESEYSHATMKQLQVCKRQQADGQQHSAKATQSDIGELCLHGLETLKGFPLYYV